MWQRTPVARAISKTAALATVSATAGPARAVALRRVAALVEEAPGQAADDRGALVVEGDREAGVPDRREQLVELPHVVAGEAHRVVFVGDLETLKAQTPASASSAMPARARALLRGAV